MGTPKVDNWIYVTGAPRSGTTFVGDMLSYPLSVDYIHEPFNPDCGIPTIKQRYLYVSETNEDPELMASIESLFDYSLKLRTGFFRNDSKWRRRIKRLTGSRGPVYLRMAKANVFRKACVIKDPIGCLLTEYLSQKYHVKPLVMLRHPIGFVASTTRLKWDTELDLAHLASQPEMVERYFADEPEFLTTVRATDVEKAAAMWRALNKVLLTQCKQNPDWELLKHEEFSSSPREHFERLFKQFDLPWNEKTRRRVAQRTSSSNQVESKQGQVQTFNRDSAKIFELRKSMLTVEQRRKVFEITADLALDHYDESSFDLTP